MTFTEEFWVDRIFPFNTDELQSLSFIILFRIWLLVFSTLSVILSVLKVFLFIIGVGDDMF